LASTTNGGDPCDVDQHYVISEVQRSISYIPGSHDSLLCDNYNIINGISQTPSCSTVAATA
jgi:hypothetical protein